MGVAAGVVAGCKHLDRVEGPRGTIGVAGLVGGNTARQRLHSRMAGQAYICKVWASVRAEPAWR